jgi:hypothetical protein
MTFAVRHAQNATYLSAMNIFLQIRCGHDTSKGGRAQRTKRIALAALHFSHRHYMMGGLFTFLGHFNVPYII